MGPVSRPGDPRSPPLRRAFGRAARRSACRNAACGALSADQAPDTARLDADVLAWLKAGGQGYQAGAAPCAGQRGHFLVGGEAGRAVGVAVHVAKIRDQGGGDGTDDHPQHQQRQEEVEQRMRQAAEREAEPRQDDLAREAESEQHEQDQDQQAGDRLPEAKGGGDDGDDGPERITGGGAQHVPEGSPCQRGLVHWSLPFLWVRSSGI
ncbi:BrnA antitoxin family protein [Phaeovulum vinaykumarii]|uniref:BrnA antitoxin family protein n=1 Tax=Phaeovulum vinaykumarii TaxID=407234 RepID=UPI0038B3FDF6